MNGWMDFASAPRDGTEFLLYEVVLGVPIYSVVKWNNGKLVLAWDHQKYQIEDGMLWQALPKGPNV